MPFLNKLSLSHLRNIESAELHPAAGFNVLYGNNGSGKSSVLEAIYVLGMGRSFRSNLQKSLIQDGEKELTLFTSTTDRTTVGITRRLRGSQQIKINGSKAPNISELARTLPLQLINSDTFNILEGSPSQRRRFLDWGVFHVEQHFFGDWGAARRALQNRNSLLKAQADAKEILPWTIELSKHAEQIDLYRQAYTNKLLASLTPIISQLLDESLLSRFSLEYYRGWDGSAQELSQALNASLARDRKYGYTTLGPQRADLRFRIGGNDAVEVLSRGQQKMLVSALKIAQGYLLQEETNQGCIYLIDDLPSELDRDSRFKICELLRGLESQVFITSIEKESLDMDALQTNINSPENKLFHVKHGKISQC